MESIPTLTPVPTPPIPIPTIHPIASVPVAPICQACHIQVRKTDYFCFNCGKNLHPAPMSTSVATQLAYYVGSLVLPPMGLIWGIRYLKEKNPKAKIVGIVCIVLTIALLIYATKITIDLINKVNDQVNSQMQNIQGL